jgi:hypothetical protein
MQIQHEADIEKLYIQYQHDLDNLKARLDRALELELRNHELVLVQIRAELEQTIQAARLGLTRGAFEQLMLEEVKLEREIKRQERLNQVELRHELDKSRGHKQIELEALSKQADIEQDNADRVDLVDYGHIKELTGNLFQLRLEEQHLLNSTLPQDVKQPQLARVRKNIKFLEKDISERQKRLLPPAKGKAVRKRDNP